MVSVMIDPSSTKKAAPVVPLARGPFRQSGRRRCLRCAPSARAAPIPIVRVRVDLFLDDVDLLRGAGRQDIGHERQIRAGAHDIRQVGTKRGSWMLTIVEREQKISLRLRALELM